jgi:hypothetical protein
MSAFVEGLLSLARAGGDNPAVWSTSPLVDRRVGAHPVRVQWTDARQSHDDAAVSRRIAWRLNDVAPEENHG